MLNDKQIDKLRRIETPWGEIGWIVYKRTYARRIKEDKVDSPTEEFIDTIVRIINACDKQLKVGFTPDEEEELSELLLKLKGSVAGRFLWQLGTKTVDKLGLPSLQNCASCVVNEPIRPFVWAMEMLMLGAGVGFNIQKEHVYQLPKLTTGKKEIIRFDSASADFIVPDTREGWVKLLGKVLKSHFYTGKGFSYSTQLIRSKGAPIKGFGGTSSGPEILCQGIDDINRVLNKRSGKKLRPIDCLDIMNIIGSIVVSGNVRRCLPVYYEVKMADGSWKCISDCRIGDCIEFNGQSYPIKNVFIQGEQKLIKISTPHGFHICTPNHRWLVKDIETGEISWKFASELSCGRYMISKI